ESRSAEEGVGGEVVGAVAAAVEQEHGPRRGQATRAPGDVDGDAGEQLLATVGPQDLHELRRAGLCVGGVAVVTLVDAVAAGLGFEVVETERVPAVDGGGRGQDVEVVIGAAVA